MVFRRELAETGEAEIGEFEWVSVGGATAFYSNYLRGERVKK